MKKWYIGVLCSCALMCSCSTIKRTAQIAEVTPTVVSMTVADMDVSLDKISKTNSWSYNMFRKVSVEEIKRNTTAEMLSEAEADVLIEPQYIVRKGGFMRGGSVTVIGFPAKFTDFHKMTAEEAEIFKNAQEGKKPKEKRRKFLGLF